MRTEELSYELPEELIAQRPLPRRDGARLLRFDRASGAQQHYRLVDLPELLPPGCLLVVNDSRVIPARLRGHRASGGAVEVLLVERLTLGGSGQPGGDPDAPAAGHERCAEGCAERWRCIVRSSKRLRAGETIEIVARPGVSAPPPPRITLLEAPCEGETLALVSGSAGIFAHGGMPLPPYIRRPDDEQDRERYQTVYAREEGSIAAPTAGLHLTHALLDGLARRGIELRPVTLHVGPGTFRPVRVEHIADHRMDAERYVIPEETAAALTRARTEGRPVVAVGTTVVRALEGSGGFAGPGRTDLFIRSGYRFSLVDGLLTNFHLPRSTLLMLVCAFAGREPVLAAYREAVARRYRFYSFGDAMLIV